MRQYNMGLDLEVSMTIRVDGGMQDALSKIAYKQGVPISAVVREYLTRMITESDYHFLEGYKLHWEVESMERFLKDSDKKATFLQKYLRKLCYMVLYGDSLNRIKWRLDTQIKRGCYFCEDLEVLKELRGLFGIGSVEKIIKFMEQRIDWELLRFKVEFDSVCGVFNKQLRKMMS